MLHRGHDDADALADEVLVDGALHLRTCGWWAGQWWRAYAKAEKARKAHQKEHPPWTAKSWNTVPRPPLVTTPTCDVEERPTERPKR